MKNPSLRSPAVFPSKFWDRKHSYPSFCGWFTVRHRPCQSRSSAQVDVSRRSGERPTFIIFDFLFDREREKVSRLLENGSPKFLRYSVVDDLKEAILKTSVTHLIYKVFLSRSISPMECYGWSQFKMSSPNGERFIREKSIIGGGCGISSATTLRRCL